MKLLFATLLCHRDVDTFIFNWFCCRINLSNGFSIPHLILQDGSLTEEDLARLRKLPWVYLIIDPVELYEVPKPKLLAKLKLLDVGFMKYEAERVVIIDSDVFFYRLWDNDLVNILMSENISMMDFGCSTGPDPDKYKKYFGVISDEVTPTCNTGIFSTTKKYYPQILLTLIKHIKEPFQIMEDQGVLFTATYGKLSYIQGIKVVINGSGDQPVIWDHILKQNGAHLVGMRTRKDEYNRLISHVISLMPQKIHPKYFPVSEYSIYNGRLEYDIYSFKFPYAAYPSQCNGVWVTDAIYLSKQSHIRWYLPPQITKFEASIMVLDGSVKEGIRPILINGQHYPVGSFQIIDIKDHILHIDTRSGRPGEENKVYYALTYPRFHTKLDRPSTVWE